MGIKNFLIEGVSCSGKTTVCNELQRRGYNAIHGDRELAYQGDPINGKTFKWFRPRESYLGCRQSQSFDF